MYCSLTNFAFWGAFICPATRLKQAGDHYWLLISTVHLSGMLEAKIWSVSKCKYVPIDLWKNVLHYKVLSKKARKEEEREYEFASVCDTKKKLIGHCYLEAWILYSTNSFLFFKKREGPDEDTSAHFVSHSTFFAKEPPKWMGLIVVHTFSICKDSNM